MTPSMRSLVSTGLLLASTAAAQTTTQVVLNYNFNGVVHSGEAGLPDDLNGYRSISDRGLDFSGGVPNDALLNPYSIIGTPNTLDIVHLGNRNAVDNGNWAFDPSADGDNIGVQPTWLAAVDQSGPQTTVLGAPVLLEASSTVTVLFQISNGGGTFDVTFDFQAGGSTTATLSGGDWFGGAYAGTGSVDFAGVDSNLSITEGSVDLSAHSGQMLTAITFENRSNVNAGYAILAANVHTDPNILILNQIPLNYNFNGVVHAGEAGLPDDPNGYRSISDRGLDFSGGVPSDSLLDPYTLVDAPAVLDIVHLGNRNAVDNGNWAFDPSADGDNIGVQPTWLPVVDQSGPQTTVLGTPINLVGGSAASFLYQISNGGGTFDVTFDFQSGGSTTATLGGGDWFGGAYTGTGSVDIANADNNLSITEGTVDLTADAGEVLTQISFSNQSNPNAGYAILAANVTGSGQIGTPYCGPASLNSTGQPGVISAVGSDQVAHNNVRLDAAQLALNQNSYFITSQTQGSVMPPGSQGFLCLGGTIGRFNQNVLNTGGAGEVSLQLDLTDFPIGPGVAVQPGETWNFQLWYRDANPGATSNFTDGVSILFQ